MPYVRCSSCGITSYTAPPHMFSADCPTCGHTVLPPGAGGRRERPSVTEKAAEARAEFAFGARRNARTIP